MLDLPQQTLNKVKKYLLRQQKEVDERIEALEKEDPILLQAAPEASESGTDSWQADVHGRLMTLKDDLVGFSKTIKSSLLRINKGSYGKCEGCNGAIEAERLEAMPTATLCIACSQKKR